MGDPAAFLRCQGKFLPAMLRADRIVTVPSAVVPGGCARVISHAPS